MIALVTPAFASEYAEPDLSDYYASLKQPDNPTISCCGGNDAYYADQTETDANGGLIAIITDTRPDTFTLPDGRVIHRQHLDVGTRIPVPPEKIRKHPIPNPTGHTIIFVSSGGTYVFCYEPQPGI